METVAAPGDPKVALEELDDELDALLTELLALEVDELADEVEELESEPELPLPPQAASARNKT